MGVILAKFRKEKTTYEVLEDLEEKIKDIESFTISTQARQKRFVGNFLVFSVGLYVISSIVFYFAFFPSTWSKRIIYSTPLLIFPILIILLKRVVAWFFQRKLNRNAQKLKELRAEKKKTIEQVMDKETYKVALEILNRFGDAATRAQHQPIGAGLRSPNTTLNQSANMSSLATPQKIAPKMVVSPQPQQRQQLLMPMPTSRTPINARSAPMASPQINPYPIGATPTSVRGPYSVQSPASVRYQHQTPFPVVNQSQKGIFEKIVDYLINDGPSTRYGMICKECYGHNGMVSQEEYEYSAFKCAFCKALNPAKKLRPIAPRLPIPVNQPGGDAAAKQPIVSRTVRSDEPSSSTTVSDKESGSDSEVISASETKKLDAVPTSVDDKASTIEKIAESEPAKEIEKAVSPVTEDIEQHVETTKPDIDKKNE